MYLERIEILPQGTPVFEVQTGYKDCKAPGSYRTCVFLDKPVCPGCLMSCRLPGYQHQGDPFVVRKRPKPDAVIVSPWRQC